MFGQKHKYIEYDFEIEELHIWRIYTNLVQMVIAGIFEVALALVVSVAAKGLWKYHSRRSYR